MSAPKRICPWKTDEQAIWKTWLLHNCVAFQIEPTPLVGLRLQFSQAQIHVYQVPGEVGFVVGISIVRWGKRTNLFLEVFPVSMANLRYLAKEILAG